MHPKIVYEILLVVFFATLQFIKSDTVVLSNKNIIDGIIEQETPQKVIINIGTGTMTVPRKNISQIKYATTNENELLKIQWAEKYFLNDRYVPPSMKQIAAEFKNLIDTRADFLRTKNERNFISMRMRTVENETEEIKKTLSYAANELSNISPSKDIKKYNETVEKVNLLRASMIRKQFEKDDLMKKLQETEAVSLRYIEKITAFEDIIQKVSNDNHTEQEEKFLALLTGRFEQVRKDIKKDEIPIIYKNGNSIVHVAINGIIGNFVIDTGAALVAITEDFLKKTKDIPPPHREIELIMADGSRRTAKVILISSVKVGETELNNVEAAVLPSISEDNIDGLLGMNYLGHFQFNIVISARRLILNRLIQ